MKVTLYLVLLCSLQHLNIKSLGKKIYELYLILKHAYYDIVLISETHITLDSHPRSFYC